MTKVLPLDLRRLCEPRQAKCVSFLRSTNLALILLAMAATVGCGSQGNSGVSGTITLDGAPLSTGRVSLAPTGSGTSASGGIVDGKYTVPLKVDAYPAAYVVRVSSPQPTGRMIAHPDGPNGKMEEIAEVIPPRYNAASELTITLNSASDHEFNFDLATKIK